MNIDSNSHHKSFSIEGNGLNWNIVDNLSGNFIAGLIAAAITINESYNITVDSIKIPKVSALYNYIIADDIIDNINLYRPDPNKLGIWVRNGLGKYYLFQFSNEDFIKGFITIFDLYGKDFRYYILGPPFDNRLIKYNIEGYDIEDYTVNVKIPVPIAPYYIQQYEDDPFDIDFI